MIMYVRQRIRVLGCSCCPRGGWSNDEAVLVSLVVVFGQCYLAHGKAAVFSWPGPVAFKHSIFTSWLICWRKIRDIWRQISCISCFVVWFVFIVFVQSANNYGCATCCSRMEWITQCLDGQLWKHQFFCAIVLTTSLDAQFISWRIGLSPTIPRYSTMQILMVSLVLLAHCQRQLSQHFCFCNTCDKMFVRKYLLTGMCRAQHDIL